MVMDTQGRHTSGIWGFWVLARGSGPPVACKDWLGIRRGGALEETPASPAGEVQAVQSGRTVVWCVGRGQPRGKLERSLGPVIPARGSSGHQLPISATSERLVSNGPERGDRRGSSSSVGAGGRASWRQCAGLGAAGFPRREEATAAG